MFKKILSVSVIAVGLTGCSAIQLNHNATKVIVSKNVPPKSCKYVQQIVGSQGGAFTGAYTSNKNMAIGAMNDMKNQAADLGANYIQLETNQAGVTGSGGSGPYGGGGGFSQTDVTNIGNAYRCPPDSIGL